MPSARERIRMVYRKISLELIVFAEEADAVVAKLNWAIDTLEERHAVFGGDVEVTEVNKNVGERKTALKVTLAAGNAAVIAVKGAADTVADAYKRVV